MNYERKFIMKILGDTHNSKVFQMICQNADYEFLISVGDNGIGIDSDSIVLPPNVFFIRGNHDNPNACQNHPNYLGDYGITQIGDKSIFFVSGARSIDHAQRFLGVNYWDNEELNYWQADDCLLLWEKYHREIDIVISHDCPQIIFEYESQTSKLLQEMFMIARKSNISLEWYFGHHHKEYSVSLENIHFHGLGINQIVNVD